MPSSLDMAHTFVLVTGDINLQTLAQQAIEQAFGENVRISTRVGDAEAALKAIKAPKAGADNTFVVLDARVPPTKNVGADQEGRAALHLLRELRQRSGTTRAIVITPRASAMPEIDEYCSPENGAIA